MATKQKIQGIEISDDAPTIDLVSELKDFAALASSEVFMNEHVTIMVHSTTDENQPPQVIVNCNGMNQPIIRGYPTTIKRKYVEILARMKETKYSQVTRNPAAPDQIDMVARHGLSYPFDLVEDKNPRGRAWLTNVMAEPA
ncbi:hypothetical protein UFOVP474_23 [uncultured Caudovirales phage]|uniref:Uncharacterized protein n=1 Tax=uncultured Caudovirales phage TaxID=2100421 RepID=A0A6J5MG63_9CAUD|nr:hypothetical protein UFOVP474_23 [uncultured Caudovirales phage]CAB4189619.1 hypothetical protein UFOVP1207_19 [uncultured Caudovirales phage]